MSTIKQRAAFAQDARAQDHINRQAQKKKGKKKMSPHKKGTKSKRW